MTVALVGVVVLALALGVRDVALRYMAMHEVERRARANDTVAARVALLEARVGEQAGEGALFRRVVQLERAAATRVRR